MEGIQRHLDQSPVPFPETEANIALKLSAVPESIIRIFNRFKEGEITKEMLTAKLDGLFDKGTIYAEPRLQLVCLNSKWIESPKSLQWN